MKVTSLQFTVDSYSIRNCLIFLISSLIFVWSFEFRISSLKTQGDFYAW
jgi:hypothetical protein